MVPRASWAFEPKNQNVGIFHHFSNQCILPKTLKMTDFFSFVLSQNPFYTFSLGPLAAPKLQISSAARPMVPGFPGCFNLNFAENEIT